MPAVLALLACAAPESGAAGPVPAGQPDSGRVADTGAPWWEAATGDADGDGVTAADGDCDDGRAGVHPGAEDTCDGVDGDCDGVVDEDWGGDDAEPNGWADTPTDLGDLGTEGQVLVTGFLFPEPGETDDDVDRWGFTAEDGTWDWFDLEAWLYGPAGADLAVDLYAGDTLVATADDAGAGGYELAEYGGGAGDDGGAYTVVVRAVDGATCAAPYTLHLLMGSW